MTFSEKIFLQDAIFSVKICIKQSLKLILCMFFDLAFFVVYGMLSAPVFSKLTDHVIILGTFVSDAMKKTGRTYVNNQSLIDLLLKPQILPFFFKFLLLLALLGAIVYIVYCVFQGINWKLSSELAGYDVSWRQYLKAFSKINLLWFGLFVIYYFTSLFFAIRKTIILKFNPAYAPNYFWEVGFAILLFAALYFMILTYVSGTIKIGLKAAIHGWKDFAPPIILIMLVFLAIDWVMLKTGFWKIEAAYFFGVVLFLPALTITKVYIFRVAAKLCKNGILPQY